MVIDMHTHWFNGDMPFSPAHWKETIKGTMDLYLGLVPGSNFTEETVEANWADPDGSRLIATMDADGVDVSVVLPIDYGILHGVEANVPWREANKKHIELARKYPGRIVPFYGIDPRRENAGKMFAEDMAQGGYKGLKLYPPCGFFPSDEACWPLYEVCLEYDIPVLYHGADSGFFSENDGSHPVHVRRTMDKFPDLRVVYAHGGGFHWSEDMTQMLKDYPNFTTDISAWVLLPEEEFQRRMARIKEVVGDYKKVFYGTDHPVYNPVAPAKVFMARIKGLKLPKEEEDGIMGEYARVFLGL